MTEIEVEARPVVGPRRDRKAEVATSVDATRRAARVLRVAAWVIAASSVIGYVLTSFWPDEFGLPERSVRQRIGGLLTFSWVPLALAALVYAVSFALLLYAARLELEAARTDRSRAG